jgi:hypothetical protein
MKKSIYILFTAFIITACSSLKTTQKAINSGDYDKAISLAVKNLRSSKTKKSNQPYISMLEEAFKKATEKDKSRIKFLKKDGNPENLERIYNLYQTLEYRQEMIKPLLPLRNIANGRAAKFRIKDYSSDLITSKNKLTALLYANVKGLFNSSNKYDFRQAYNALTYLEKIHPNYKDTRSLIEEAHAKGTDYVLVSIKNKTRKIIPKRLSKDLLNIDTYGFDDLWTVYHSVKDSDFTYDYGLALTLRDINISPEQVREKQVVIEREVKDGWKYLLDKEGNQVIDDKGNKVKVDKMVNVRCEFFQFTQFKSAEVVGQVQYTDLASKQLLKTFPIKSMFVFEHNYATFNGDKRALTKSFLDMIILRSVKFPSNEQMVYDAGNDLKQHLKEIVQKNKFRN